MKKLLFLLLVVTISAQAQKRPRDLGIKIGVLSTGKLNAITDVAGVKVGHRTLLEGTNIRTGVTAIIPHDGNLFQDKVPAAVFVGNGFGKLAGTTQLIELGNIEAPIVLTNTLSVAVGIEAVVEYTLAQKGNESVQSVNAVVGETNDGYLNDIRGRHVTKQHVQEALAQAQNGMVVEGNVGAGTGTVCFGFKGGIGTSSRLLPQKSGGYTVGVLVQTNFGGVLQIDGVPVGEALKKFFMSDQLQNPADGSCMIVVATDAPLDARNLERLAKRAFMGLAKTGGIASNGSGDYVIAFSTHAAVRIKHQSDQLTYSTTQLNNDSMSPLFMAAIEATEEAIINSLWAAQILTGKDGRTIQALPRDEVIKVMKQHNALK
ncbi:MAG TPA: P1 family peptidase [Cyclobacteriaceae bacterium]|jgi:D-aminopeptidase|nr:P1 family peptidase [Cytophagales bacterium]HRE66636.1 P1 family peptidase [Cyclobacteriaceae bacterium]HRF35172.1 P1 family peptidase [Cyclobacteriaceae bacterium]